MGPLQYLNSLLCENHSTERFQQTTRGNLKTTKYPKKDEVRKIESILQRHCILYNKRIDNHRRTIFVLVKRKYIPASVLDWKPLIPSQLLKSELSKELEAMRRIFCWEIGNALVKHLFPYLSRNVRCLPYNHDNRPVFDEQWHNMIYSSIDEDSIYERPRDYLIQAQRYVHLFFDSVPQLLEDKYVICHPAILLTALCIALKVGDEGGMNTINFVEALYGRIIPPNAVSVMIKNFNKMERIFLKAIDYRTRFIEPFEHAMGFHLSPSSLDPFSVLKNSEKGTYIIQKNHDHYLFSIVADTEAFNIEQI